MNSNYATTGNSASLADKHKKELKQSTLKAMRQFDRRMEHMSTAKEAKKSKAVLNDSSSEDEDYMYASKNHKRGAQYTPVKDNAVFGSLLNKLSNSP